MRGLSSAVVGIAALLLVAGCGSSSGTHSSSSSKQSAGPSVVDGVSVRSVERALLRVRTPPRPTTAACRASSAAERAGAPFGHTPLPLFTCELTLTGEPATYVVQVLHNGCFVAERRRPGRAVYGCGADRT